MNRRSRDVLALAAWTAFLVATLAGLHALGGGPLAAPPVRGVVTWLGGRDPTLVLFAFVRLALLGVGWYLLASTVLAVVLRLVRADVAAGAVEACSPASVGRLVRAAAGLSLAASVVVVSSAAASEGDELVTMRRLPDAGSPAADGTDVTDDPEAAITMTRLDDVSPPPAATTPHRSTWTVVAGDSFWSIAERTLAEAWFRPPSDAEIDPYWRQLVEQNRLKLQDPQNPDLIHPAMVLDLPERSPNPPR